MRLYNNSARKQRRIYADKKIDYFAAFQKIFCGVTASSETTDRRTKKLSRETKTKKKQTSQRVIYFSEEISSDARKKSLSRIIITKHNERF